MFLYPYKEELDSVNNRKLTNGYDIIDTTTYCDFKKSSNKFEDDSYYKSTKSEILIQFWMHKDCAKELLEVNIQCFRKREKNIFYGMYILGVKKNFIELHVYQDVWRFIMEAFEMRDRLGLL